MLLEGFGGLRWRTIDRRFLQETAQQAQKVLQGFELTPINRDREDNSERSFAKLWRFVRTLDRFQRLAREVRRIGFKLGSDLRRFSLFHAFNYLPPGRANIPLVPVVYDLSYIRYPDAHPPARLRAMEQLEHDIKAAPVVHTISEPSGVQDGSSIRLMLMLGQPSFSARPMPLTTKTSRAIADRRAHALSFTWQRAQRRRPKCTENSLRRGLITFEFSGRGAPRFGWPRRGLQRSRGNSMTIDG